MPVESVVEHERIWVEGLNRGDVSAADAAFAPDCVVHITGVAEPVCGVGPWKDFVAGLAARVPRPPLRDRGSASPRGPGGVPVARET